MESSFELHPQQLKAFESKAQEILYGGAAAGGKSHLMRVAAILYCCQIPGLTCYLFRRTIPELMQTHMEGPGSLPVLLAPLIAAGMARIRNRLILFWNGARIRLASCEHVNDVYGYQGAEIHLLLIDELTHWKEEMYNFLVSRCRVIGRDVQQAIAAAGFGGQFPKIICGTNPGNIGHVWVKRRWVDPAKKVNLHCFVGPADEGGMIRRFVPAKMKDNPTMLEYDPQYVQRLRALKDPVLVRAMLEGDWDIVAGAIFGEHWRATKPETGQEWHVVTPRPLPSGWEYWRGADDGFGDPFAGYWLTRDPDIGTFWVIAELYRSMMTPEAVAENVRRIEFGLQMDIGTRRPETNSHALDGMIDSAAFSKHGVTDKARGRDALSRGEQMNNLGLRWKPVDKWPGSRIQRVQNLQRLLQVNRRDPDRGPGIRFFNTCASAIETIPYIPRDKNNAEDVDDNAEIHAFDGVTYGLQKKMKRRTSTEIVGI